MPIDEFSGESGLKEDYDGTVTAAEFEQGQRGNWNLRLTVTADDGQEVPYLYSVGGKDSGWTSFDGGETIQGPSAKSRYHQNSAIQSFINAVMKTQPDDGGPIRERSTKSFDGKGPFTAAFWVGLRFHWDILEETARRPKEDGSDEWENRKIQVSRPTRFLGISDGSTSSPTKPNTSSGTATTNGATDIDPNDLKTLTRLANTHDTHGEFLDAVMEESFSNGEKGVRNKPVLKASSKKDFYESLRI